MTKETRKFITLLRQQFTTADDNTKRQIWHILTGLRGPDSEIYDEKRATTAVIRYTVFGLKSGLQNVADIYPDSANRKDFRVNNEFKSNHFQNHAEYAFSALGLKWNEVNLPKTKKKIK